MAGSLKLRGRIWWMRYYINGRRIERTTRTDDRVEASRQLADAMASVPPPMHGPIRTDGPCAVYVIAEQGAGHRCKVGVSESPRRRLTELQTARDRTLVVVAERWFDSRDAAMQEELALHDGMAADRMSGEWFSVAPDFAARALFGNPEIGPRTEREAALLRSIA